ncbi:uncharacterized protein TRIVIDRAFT_222601 [Trichoderma virens Gv29-8]|uniref:Uncharacterized protein n=1 Tax=Hypocrea virens (strain Gv29-8 / FGSC 10586) TaxID=413071 RepID=G9MUD8_HYPVG|nr:uncharacterized protein TRIVIDRAFT_222601 [Trichoderma virens Gv29-8]EHK21951.1 hypothetical protein TRIVIDRAFT_222601 [Trichoderma virens Gv29-8]UKZ48284.1 hypothetical protein TrVGV298_002507 [Trichoderma virens]
MTRASVREFTERSCVDDDDDNKSGEETVSSIGEYAEGSFVVPDSQSESDGFDGVTKLDEPGKEIEAWC